MAKFPAPTEDIVLTYFIVSRDVERSRRFYTEVLGGETVLEGEPTVVALANGWIIINVGGGPTDDKPTVTLEAPSDQDRVSAFLNIRVADIHAVYEEWSGRGAEFLTPPIDRGREVRCYIRDPDGHLIEVGQSIGVVEGRTPAQPSHERAAARAGQSVLLSQPPDAAPVMPSQEPTARVHNRQGVDPRSRSCRASGAAT
jgi:catechol 2,3-dioxygenase-like lactoylglutathione lyase family enzyme